MEQLYPFFIAFFLVFISELGDKTQLLVLSFSGKTTSFSILLGVALGSFFSHGFAILFGSSISLLGNDSFHSVLEIITFCSFLLFGLISLIPFSSFKNDTYKDEASSSKKKFSPISSLLHTLAHFGLRICIYNCYFYCYWWIGW